MKLDIETFDVGTDEEKARKVCEEAIEFYAEHAIDIAYEVRSNRATDCLKMEIGDVFTALANYCAARGINAQDCIDLANTKNTIRGRYDTIES